MSNNFNNDKDLLMYLKTPLRNRLLYIYINSISEVRKVGIISIKRFYIGPFNNTKITNEVT